jgi:hypothetical protein
MNLVFEKAMLDPSGTGTMVRYVSEQAVFHPGPSGLSEEAAAAAGERPLRIIARGVFGIRPTDLIIDRADSLLVVSSEANRRLLSQGRVVIALNDRVLKSPLVQ